MKIAAEEFPGPIAQEHVCIRSRGQETYKTIRLNMIGICRRPTKENCCLHGSIDRGVVHAAHAGPPNCPSVLPEHRMVSASDQATNGFKIDATDKSTPSPPRKLSISALSALRNLGLGSSSPDIAMAEKTSFGGVSDLQGKLLFAVGVIGRD